jgi:hypothetical protein
MRLPPVVRSVCCGFGWFAPVDWSKWSWMWRVPAVLAGEAAAWKFETGRRQAPHSSPQKIIAGTPRSCGGTDSLVGAGVIIVSCACAQKRQAAGMPGGRLHCLLQWIATKLCARHGPAALFPLSQSARLEIRERQFPPPQNAWTQHGDAPSQPKETDLLLASLAESRSFSSSTNRVNLLYYTMSIGIYMFKLFSLCYFNFLFKTKVDSSSID